MKIRYYLMSMAFLATASVSFTACDDDDPVDQPITIVQPGQGGDNIEFSKDTITLLKGSTEALPVTGGSGIKAYSLDTDIAQVAEEGGAWTVKAVGNGETRVLVSIDGGVYDAFLVRSYVTETITLATTSTTLPATLLGWPTIGGKVKITDGNGKYTVKSDNPNVTVSVDNETNEIAFEAIGEANAINAKVTVTDWMDKTATLTVNVPASETDPFDQATIDELLALTASSIGVYGVHDDHYLNEHSPYYFRGNNATNANNWINTNADGMHTFGWERVNNGGFVSYGGFNVTYPETATVGEAVQGTWKFAYSTLEWWPTHNFSGTVKVIRDDDTMQAVVFYGVDSRRPVLDYGWCVWVK